MAITRDVAGLNIDPVWGGTGDTVASTMYFRLGRFYASQGNSV